MYSAPVNTWKYSDLKTLSFSTRLHKNFSCASNVADESGKYVNNVPCIVCANSIPNYGSSHKTKEVAKVLRRFLNKLIKYHDPKSTGNFNKRTMLAYTLEGKQN